MSLTKPSKQALAELINAANGTGYTANTLGHGAPAVYSAGGADRNTVIEVWHTAKPDIKYSVYFLRLDLAVQFADIEGIYEAATPQALLDALNEERGTALALDDLVDFTIPQNGGSVTLTAAATSLGYIGSLTVDVDDGTPAQPASTPEEDPEA